jgi:tetratricopeptide (TPR) repeat protein
MLDLPTLGNLPSPRQLTQYSAIQLFVERANAVWPGFTLTEENAIDVTKICHCLDGLPLAIILAAARTKMFPPSQILQQLEHSLAFLKQELQDTPSRHQTLRNVVDWSYKLLNQDEKSLFRHVGVFHGWTIKAAQIVCEEPDIHAKLEALVDKSLVQPVTSAMGMKFQMLQTIREYALEQLEVQGESKVTQHRHAIYFLEFAREAEQAIGTNQQQLWASRIKDEHNNLQAAFNWMLEQGEAEMALELTGSLWRFWQLRSVLSEGLCWIERALAQGTSIKSIARVKTLWGAGWLADCQANFDHALALFKEGLSLAKELGSKRFVALLSLGIGTIQCCQNNLDKAESLFEESLNVFREIHDQEQIAWSLDHLGRLALAKSNYQRAQSLFEESLGIFHDLGNQWGIALSMDRLGHSVWMQGEYEHANHLFEKALHLFQKLGNSEHTAWTLYKLASTFLAQGHTSQAKYMLKESLTMYTQTEDTPGILTALEGFAALAVTQGDYVSATQLCGAIQSLLGPHKVPVPFFLSPYRLKQLLSISRAYLNEPTFTTAWETGKSMTLENAINCAQEILQCAETNLDSSGKYLQRPVKMFSVIKITQAT